MGGEVGADPPRELLERRRGPGHLGPMSASERARSRASHKLLQTPLTVGSELLPELGGLLHHSSPRLRKFVVKREDLSVLGPSTIVPSRARSRGRAGRREGLFRECDVSGEPARGGTKFGSCASGDARHYTVL